MQQTVKTIKWAASPFHEELGNFALKLYNSEEKQCVRKWQNAFHLSYPLNAYQLSAW